MNCDTANESHSKLYDPDINLITDSEEACDLPVDDEGKEEDAETFLRNWTHSNNIAKTALSELLKFLRVRAFPNLPADYRTLLKTPTQRQTTVVSPGKYCHIGLFRALDCYIQNCSVTPHI